MQAGAQLAATDTTDVSEQLRLAWLAGSVPVEETQGLEAEVLEGRAVVRPELVGIVPGGTCFAQEVAAIDNRCRKLAAPPRRCTNVVAIILFMQVAALSIVALLLLRLAAANSLLVTLI